MGPQFNPQNPVASATGFGQTFYLIPFSSTTFALSGISGFSAGDTPTLTCLDNSGNPVTLLDANWYVTQVPTK